MDAPAIVIASGAAMTTAAVLPVFRSPEGLLDASTYKRIWAAGVLTLVLAVGADLVPQFVGPLALSLILVVIVKSGLFGKTKTAPINPTPKGTH